MDANRFDILTKTLAAARTRRGLLSLLAGLPLAIVIDDGGAAGRRKRKERRREADAEACIPTGKRCPSKKPRGRKRKSLGCDRCCQGFVNTAANGKRQCGCKPAGESCATGGAAACCSGICTGNICQDGSCAPGDDGKCCGGGVCVGGACEARATLAMCGGRCDADDLPATFQCAGGDPAPCPACDGGCAEQGCADGGARLFTPEGESFYCVVSVAPTGSPCEACPTGIPNPIFCPPGCQTPGTLCSACPEGEGCLAVVCLEICTGE